MFRGLGVRVSGFRGLGGSGRTWGEGAQVASKGAHGLRTWGRKTDIRITAQVGPRCPGSNEVSLKGVQN